MGEKSRTRTTLAAATGLLFLASSASAAGTFGYRKTLTLNGVTGGPHADFPVLVRLVDADLQAHVASPAGHDIVFRGEDAATCGGPPTCTLDHEIEQWDGATGTLLAWVRVPALSAGTVLFLYYGNGQITSSTEAPAAVWDADYVGVWHLEEPQNAAVNGYRDSSRYGNHGRGGRGTLAAAPTRVASGSIGAAQHFDDADGTYDFIDGGDDATLHIAGNQITLEAWVRHNITIDAAHGTPPIVDNPYGIFNHKGYYDGYRLVLEGASWPCPDDPITRPCLTFSLPGNTHQLRTTQSASLDPNQWHHVVATYDGATMDVFVDGVNEGSLPKTGNVAPSTADQAMWIGHGDQPENQGWSAQYEGDLDEVRISRVARSAEWIATEYANQSSPATFHSVGGEAPGSYPVGTLTVNHRSIGTGGTLYSTGTASVPLGGTVVTFGGGASLPASVGRGDALTFTGAPVETLYVLSRDSAVQVTLQTPPTAAHAGQSYTISRAFNTLAGWESAREGDLVLERRREIGIAYNDGPLAGGLTIDGSTTDPAHSLTLTVAPGHRHQGGAGTGVVIDNGSSGSPAIEIRDDHVTVEWFEIRGTTAALAHGIELAGGLAPANLSTVRFNVIHDFGGDGIRVGDANAIADIYGNIVYETEYGVHLPVDLTPAARVNVFSNTIFSCNSPGGPSGVTSDVRQTSVRVDLRNNIAHSNANGDFGVGPFFDYGYFCNPGCTQIANGGMLGPTEYLADRGNNTPLDLTNVGTSCLYLGSAWPFRGVNVALGTPGVLSGTDLQWDYWNGTSWTSLEAGSFADGTFNLRWTAPIYWPDDPPGWTSTSVSTSPALYYVRACLAAGSYTTLPVEEQITRVDVSIASRNNLASDITGRAHSVLWGGSTGFDSVTLPGVGFANTGPGTEDLHINAGSAAADVGLDLGRRFVADIDGALRVDPWDIGADEASASTGPDLAIAKDDGQATAVPGTPVTYTITVTNNGPGLLTSAIVVDALPAEIQGPVFTPSGGVYDPGTGVWTGLNLGPSLSATLTLQGTIAPWARGTLLNAVRVDPPGGVTDPDPSNNSAVDADTLTPSADLALAKSDLFDPAAVGRLLTYTLTVTNNGPSDATGVVLTDTLVPEMAYDSAAPSQGSCGYDVPTRVLTCSLGTVPFPGSATVTLTVRPIAAGIFTNTASVGGTEPDPSPGNNTATEPTTVQSAQSCIVTTDLGGGDDSAQQVLVEPDGRIVVGGWGHVSNPPVSDGDDFAAVRYTAGLRLDTSFDSDGIALKDIWGHDHAEGLAIQPDGKILLGGTANLSGMMGCCDEYALWRLNADGSIDTGFGAPNGYVRTNVNSSWDLGRTVAIQTDGKILLGGRVDDGAGNWNFGLVRYNPDGSLDTTGFNPPGGMVVTSVGPGDDFGNSLAIQADGRILLAGATWNGANWDWAIVRYNTDGSLDSSFGTGGIVVTAMRSGDDWGNSIVLQPDGKILLGGKSSNGTDMDFALARYNSDGSLDPSFGTGGKAFTAIGAGEDDGEAIALQPDGKVVHVGYTTNGVDTDFALVRYNPDGSLDASFGAGGKVTTPIGADREEARGVTLQPDGRIVVAGRSYNVATLNWDFAVARYTPDGSLDAGCGARYRSIGTAADYSVGTVSVATGSSVVTGSGSLWRTANRGRGDRITIGGTAYTVLQVDAENQLTLTLPFAGTSGSYGYSISRKFATLADWEDCISGAALGPGCEGVSGASLIGDDRSEVGIAYKDSVFGLSGDLEIEGSTTDALHSITLTVDPGNRHDGIPGAGVLVDGQNGPNEILVRDDHVTVEWLELVRIRGGASVGAVRVYGPSGPRNVLLQNLLVHDFYDPVLGNDSSGIRLSGFGGKQVTVRNSMVWDGDENGIEADEADDTLTIENCSVDDIRGTVGRGVYAAKSQVTVRNTIVTRSTSEDFDPGSGSFTAASATNTSSDPSAPGPSAQTGVAAVAVFATPGADLHLKPGANVAVDSGVDLLSSFQNDVDGQPRPIGAAWDRGADEHDPTATVDLGITKDDGQVSAVPGTPITYTITVTNNGPRSVTALTVTDPAPGILSPVFTPSRGTYDASTGLWTFSAFTPLGPGQSVTLTLNGTVSPSATGSLVNTATVAPPPGMTDPVAANDAATDTDTLTPSADLALTKADDVDPAEIGGLLTYTLTVTNNGPSDATGVVLTDTLVPEMDYDSVTSSQGSCSYDSPTRVLTCTLGALPATGSATVGLTVRPMALGTFVNSASIAGNEPDPAAGNGSANESTLVQLPSGNGVRFLTVTSTSEQNVLEWLNPSADYVSTEIVFRTDRFPTAPGELGTTTLYDAGVAGAKDRLVHATGLGSNGQTHYYGAFVHRSAAPLVSTGRFCSGRPFDTAGPVKWAFSTGVFSMTPPTVSAAAVVAPSNDHALYAVERGPSGGEWPVGWHPALLGGPVQARSSVVPVTVNGSNPVVFLGAQDGYVYAVDGALGGATGFPWPPTSIATTVQAAPAGIFTAFGGAYDYLLVGTRDGLADNAFVALDLATGAELERFTNGGGASGMGIVSGMATVDYVFRRVYFATHAKAGGSSSTLWCLQLAPSSPGPIFTLRWARDLGDIDSSPILRNNRLYVGSALGGGTVHSIDADTGNPSLDRTFVHGDGQVKGFVWPDRFSLDLYFATDNFVWGVSDTADPMPDKFGSPQSLGAGVKPSAVLLAPGSQYLYVGDSSGLLWQIDVLGGPLEAVTLGDGLAAVGAPSLDWWYSLIHVGTEAGVFYAVDVPLPGGATCVPAAVCSTLNMGQACYNFTPAECGTTSCLGPGVCGP